MPGFGSALAQDSVVCHRPPSVSSSVQRPLASGAAAVRATTYTLGGVISPQSLPGFSLTVDYYHIKVKDAISAPAQADILNGCYSVALNPTFANNAFCQLIQRNPLNGAGETQGVILAGSNLGVIETAGIDFGVNQRIKLDDVGFNNAGQISLGFNATRLRYYHFQATPNSINRNCTAYYSAGGCTNPRPKWKWNGRVTYSLGGFDASNNGNTFPTVYDVVGRYYTMGVRLKFLRDR